MGYGSKSLNDWCDDAYRIAKDHGFHERENSFGDTIALIHTEVSEAFEEFRKGESVKEVYYETKDGGRSPICSQLLPVEGGRVDRVYNKPCGIPSELADIVIRVMDFEQLSPQQRAKDMIFVGVVVTMLTAGGLL
jgi:hypothetical protein